MFSSKHVWMVVMIIFTLLMSGCNTNNTQLDAEDERITVYTSFYTMYDFTSKIAGDKVNIINMVPSGAEPHEWEPSPRDIAGLSRAKLFVYSGAGMEGWADKVLASINNTGLVAVETSKNVKLRGRGDGSPVSFSQSDEGEEHAGHNHDDLEYDPHVWLNPMNAKMQMEAIRDGLIQVDPQNKSFYEGNYNEYAAKLDALDKAFKDAATTFTRKEIVVSHEAFGYLCSAYGLEQLAIEGISSESEPTPARMAKIIDFVREHDVKHIFFEELASPKVAETIARETGARTALLNPLEGLTEENLMDGKDYFSVMEDNLEALKQALQ